jgi:hypothetical protein
MLEALKHKHLAFWLKTTRSSEPFLQDVIAQPWKGPWLIRESNSGLLDKQLVLKPLYHLGVHIGQKFFARIARSFQEFLRNFRNNWKIPTQYYIACRIDTQTCEDYTFACEINTHACRFFNIFLQRHAKNTRPSVISARRVWFSHARVWFPHVIVWFRHARMWFLHAECDFHTLSIIWRHVRVSFPHSQVWLRHARVWFRHANV